MKSLKQLKAWLESNKEIPISLMMVDDGSNDDTNSIIQSFPLDIEIISIPMNLGKGGAIAKGIEIVKTDYVLTMDLDLSTSLDNISTFYQQIIQTKADLVVANRFHPKSQVTRNLQRNISSKIFSLIVHAIVKFKTQDTQCGFKLFKTAVAKDLFSNLNFLRFSFDLEILYRAEPKYKIIELPVRWVEKEGSSVRVIRDGLQMIIDLIKL